MTFTFKRMPIRKKIMILSFGVVLFSITIGAIILIGNIYQQKETALGDRGLITARIVANLPEVKASINESNGWEKMNPIVDRIRTINQADYIVVLNMNRVRYSHPVKEMLGTLSSGKDEGPAFAEHSYVSKARGESGVAIRSFVPIMNDQHEQIGVVIVGNMMPSLWEILQSIRKEIMLTALLTLLFGMIGSWLLARHLKQQTFQLEPYEIARLLEERTAIFQAMNEGIVAIDRNGKVVVFNERAKKLFGIKGEANGKDFHTVIKEPEVGRRLMGGEPFHHEMVRVGDKVVMATRVPIIVNEENAGEVLVFLDRTEVTKIAEELTGVKAFVDALRVQNHEHMNKLHTIAGLIQLDQKERALDFVFDVKEKQDKLSGLLTKNIMDYSISGLLLSKVSRGQELGIEVIIDHNSRLTQYPQLLDRHDFVVMLGNLIENAFDAFKGTKQSKKTIEVSLEQNEDFCTISVEDNGKGMTEQVRNQLFEKGFTTKGQDGSGIGLYLIKKIIDKGMGHVEIHTHPGEGTRFTLTFPMIGKEVQDGQNAKNDKSLAY